MKTVNKSLKRGFEHMAEENKLRELLADLEKERKEYTDMAANYIKYSRGGIPKIKIEMLAKSELSEIAAATFQRLIDKYSEE